MVAGVYAGRSLVQLARVGLTKLRLLIDMQGCKPVSVNRAFDAIYRDTNTCLWLRAMEEEWPGFKHLVPTAEV